MKRYYIHIPGDAYALDIYGKNKKDAVYNYKSWAKIERMPRGYAVWEG